MRLALAALLVAAASADPSGVGSVVLQGATLKFVPSIVPGAVAVANYTDMMTHPSGFGELTIQTNGAYNDTIQMTAAGYLEGALTAARIHEHYDNIHAWIMSHFPNTTTLPPVYSQFFATQLAWARANVASNNSALWTHLGLILAQYDGLFAGYNAFALPGQSLSFFQLYGELNSVGDMLDLLSALTPSLAPAWDSMTTEELMLEFHRRTHCSGLIKVTGNLSEIFMGHSSWFTYSSMLRVYKHYQFDLSLPTANGRFSSFSSYPGVLSSIDDFYMMQPSNLVMVQTTNNIFNTDLYKLVVPQSLLAWQRVRVANQFANGGAEWSAVIDWHNSGTYNNQYMLVDLKLFTPGAALPNDTLWVSEQIPGFVAMGDVTQELERGYWPSYNVPYFPYIYRTSGYPSAIESHLADRTSPRTASKLGDLAGLDYQLAPRAKIFRRDQGTVVDLDSFKTLMRSNNFKTDPYSAGNPFNAICSRGDFVGEAGGCYDTKVTMGSWSTALHSQAINGPTTSGGTLPPFSWTGSFASLPHEGMPTTFDFQFEDMMPRLNTAL